jgi:hypothetical protein
MLTQLLGLFSVKQAAPKPTMSQEDMDTIRSFAFGDESLRSKAIAVARTNITVLGVRGNIFMRFMAEIDTPCPDLYERDRLRKQIMEAKL